ncbi:MAG: hypothetical protein V3T77_08320, partial [Planctomycetota bacterium]
HILRELSPICDSVGIIEEGSLVAWGSVTEILERIRGESVAFVVTLVEGREGIIAKLLAHPAVTDVKLEGKELSFRYQGEEQQLHTVFSIFSREQVSFTHVRREEEDLESIFMRLTRGEVS